MRKQTYLIRKGARYHFRRRLPAGSGDNGALTLSLHTADPAEARRLARRLAVRWDEIAMIEGQRIESGNLTLAELQAIFRVGLEEELAIAVRDLAAPRKFQASDLGFGDLFIAAYEAILQVRADADHVPGEVLDTVAKDWSQKDRDALETMLAVFVPPDDIKESQIISALQQVGARVCDNTIHEARASLLRGMIEAHKRAKLFHHPLMQARGDVIGSLLDNDLVLEARRSQLPSFAPHSRTAISEHPGIYTQQTHLRFSEIIKPTLKALHEAKGWNPDNGQRQAIAERFAWLTGDKVLSDYHEGDIQSFFNRMMNVPTDFRWGKLGKEGAMAYPYEPDDVPSPGADNKRNPRTMNRDLSVLQRISEYLGKTHWRSPYTKELQMNFLEAAITVEHDPGDPRRVPWTPGHLRSLYGLPLWQGGGGSTKRLKPAKRPQVYQDAAYWVPLIATYTGLAREEACGLEVIDFNFKCEVPYLLVQANMTRSKDGIKPGGLKRKSRHRAMPLHPQLLRLGLANYVEAIASEQGSQPAKVTPIFPELYSDDAKFSAHGEIIPQRGGEAFLCYRLVLPDGCHARGEPAPRNQRRQKGRSAFTAHLQPERYDFSRSQPDDHRQAYGPCFERHGTAELPSPRTRPGGGARAEGAVGDTGTGNAKCDRACAGSNRGSANAFAVPLSCRIGSRTKCERPVLCLDVNACCTGTGNRALAGLCMVIRTPGRDAHVPPASD
jgi:hypothetical protein